MKRKITIVVLGHGNEDQLTLEAVKSLQQGPQALLLTGKHGTVPYLQQLGVKYKSMDDICRNYDNYDDACNAMIQLIL